MPYLGIFRLKFKTNIIIFEISTLEFDFSGKFREKSKMPKFETKSALFGYFFGLELENKNVIFAINTIEFL